MSAPLLRLEDLSVEFSLERRAFGAGPGRPIPAVDGVTLDVHPGEVLALVGESGCGKSTLARAAVRLVEPTRGRIVFDGHDVTRASDAELRPLRRQFQLTFQDALGSFSPRMTAGAALGEALRAAGVTTRAERRARAHELLAQVGLEAALAERYPHELSGGQRQRLGLARALAPGPRLLAADEPLAGLDASVQAQMLNLLADLREQLGLTLLFISHDLAAVQHLADRVAVMYLGRIVEVGPARELFARPRHPYTRALLAAARALEGDSAGELLEGEVPVSNAPNDGCRFHPRCPLAEAACLAGVPPLRQVGPGHLAACVKVAEP